MGDYLSRKLNKLNTGRERTLCAELWGQRLAGHHAIAARRTVAVIDWLLGAGHCREAWIKHHI